MTLNETLAALGYITLPAHQGAKHIVDGNDRIVFTGDSVEVWEWVKTAPQADGTPMNHKACKCVGTSSGPRLVMGTRLHTGRESTITEARYVEFACDVCDTPWTPGATP